VLICHGTEDPFMSSTALEQALATLQARRYRTSLLQLPARHGFTNPAQDFNDNPAFAFEQESAAKAWKQATNLLRRTLWPS
jgi:dienelactone hydrolase